MNNKPSYIVPIILVTSLFFLWAFLHNINPVLIPHLKTACQLSDTQSAFIDTAVYLAYFSIALPAGWFMHRYGYKKAILVGLFLFAVGFLLFIPAASIQKYYFFLIALFIGAAGATFLETVANPYMTKLGDESRGTQRLNFAQSFNGVGAVFAPIIGSKVILSGVEHTKEELKNMSPEQLQTYLSSEAATVKIPYLVIGLVVLMLLLVFVFTKLPEVHEADEKDSAKFSFKVFRHKNFSWAVIAQFFYVGAQVGVSSFFVRFSQYLIDISKKEATFLWGTIAMVGFMAGRFTGTFLMRYIKPERLLGIYAFVNIMLLFLAVFTHGKFAVYSLMAVPFFESIMFPTIFALGIKGLGEETKIASSFLVMSIVGGALFPLIMGQISDMTGGNMQLGYIVPMFCFAVIIYFAWRQKTTVTVAGESTALTHL
jgi:FHS family L-fucose permease-like MFS transporter